MPETKKEDFYFESGMVVVMNGYNLIINDLIGVVRFTVNRNCTSVLLGVKRDASLQALQ